jgi:hypothetical protein
MSIKSKALAGFAALALASGLAAGLTAGTATAATPSCGTSCINVYPQEYAGTTNSAPQFVTDVYRQGEKTGQPVILFRGSNSDPAEDFSYAEQGLVSDFYAAGLVGSAVALHYGCETGTGDHEFPSCAASVDDTAYELQYSPYGVDSGLCAGVGSTAVQGTKVALEPCGVSSKTVWIEDTNPGDFSPSGGYYAAINGSDTNFSHPFVLTYPAGAYPTDKPRAQLTVTNLTGFSASVNNDAQYWTGYPGILP